jgi:pantoate--beta-alanine ligase
MIQILINRKDLANHLFQLRANGLSLGFVPTMGALHDGHLSLVQKARENTDHVVVSIFVNPNQFNNSKDLELYPRDVYGDIEKLETTACHSIYIPTVEDVYPSNYQQPYYNLGELENTLEGSSRPGHFQGVAAVLERFFMDIAPEKAFFGEKDFQQVAVVRKLVELKQIPIEIVACATLREKDGLAMSSRNRRLNPELRAKAAQIFMEMQKISKAKTLEDLIRIQDESMAYLNSIDGFSVEYLEVANANSFEPLSKQSLLSSPSDWRIFAAINVGGIRLIDNCPIELGG